MFENVAKEVCIPGVGIVPNDKYTPEENILEKANDEPIKNTDSST